MNQILKNICAPVIKLQINSFHTSALALAWTKSTLPNKFLENNNKVFPPQELGEEPRPAVSIIVQN